MSACPTPVELDDAVQLAACRAAIMACYQAQSTSSGDRSVSMATLEALTKREKELITRINRAHSGGGPVFKLADLSGGCR